LGRAHAHRRGGIQIDIVGQRAADNIIPMKTKLTFSLLTFTLLFAALVCCSGAEEKINYTSTAASDVLEAACKQAAKESKLIFVKSGFPKCVWCRIFDLENELS
jgi:hypothetical protein